VLLGIEKVKGKIEVGKIADIVVFDPDVEYEVGDKDIFSKYPEISIYKNRKLRGKVVATYLNG
jgi:dihydroorotase-like cyclic amidohydrolase